MPDHRFIVLLRAVNVGGRSLVMADLRKAAEEGGFADVRTYIQSGNLILSSALDEAGVEAAIEALVEDAFKLKVIALARTAAHFERIAAANPFPDAKPKLLHLGLTKRPPNTDAPILLAPRASSGERIAVAGGALWIDFAGGVGKSKLLPAQLDKAAGSTVTARNWNTVQKLVTMASE